jgi:hypothetical protein
LEQVDLGEKKLGQPIDITSLPRAEIVEKGLKGAIRLANSHHTSATLSLFSLPSAASALPIMLAASRAWEYQCSNYTVIWLEKGQKKVKKW